MHRRLEIVARARKAPSAWKLGGLTVGQLAKRVYREFNDDDVLGGAAQLGYYFLLALFPMLLFVLALIGFFAGPGSEIRTELLRYLGMAAPESARDVIAKTVEETSAGASEGKLTFGILAALWAGSAGLSALMSTLNRAYDVEETRNWFKAKLIALGLTIALSVLVISALALVLFGGTAAEWIAAKTALGSMFVTTWKIVQWPLLLAFMFGAFALVYFFAPNVNPDKRKWQWITPGSVLGVLLWLAATAAFRVYLQYFGNYNATYGSLGAVIILTLWLYVTGMSILIGGEINSEIEHAAAARGNPEAKDPGETPEEAVG